MVVDHIHYTGIVIMQHLVTEEGVSSFNSSLLSLALPSLRAARAGGRRRLRAAALLNLFFFFVIPSQFLFPPSTASGTANLSVECLCSIGRPLHLR